MPCTGRVRVSTLLYLSLLSIRRLIWGDHARETEHETDVQQGGFDYLEAEDRLNLMLQTSANMRGLVHHNGQTLIHIAASRGLAVVFQILLDVNTM
jgi:hypothetical protein